MTRLSALLLALVASALIAPSAWAIRFTDESQQPHEAIVGQTFKLQLTAEGGTPPYTFKIESGKLPEDVVMSKDGLITGWSDDTGTYPFVVSAADSGNYRCQQPLSIVFKLPPPPQPLAEDAPGAKWHKPGWQLTFHDEFDGPILNRESWGWRYTVIPSLCVIENGIGHLRFERDFPPSLHKNGRHRISGIDSRRCPKPFAQQYGFFELRARCHKAPGGQCAFWLSPIDGKYNRLKPGGTRSSSDEANEIDIFEQQGNDPFGNNFTVHYDGAGDGVSARHVTFPFDLTADFHVYACEWNAKEVIWYVDGQRVHSTNKTPHNPFFIRLGLYEGDSDWSGKMDPNSPYPKNFDLDYIRVYRKQEAPR